MKNEGNFNNMGFVMYPTVHYSNSNTVVWNRYRESYLMRLYITVISVYIFYIRYVLCIYPLFYKLRVQYVKFVMSCLSVLKFKLS